MRVAEFDTGAKVFSSPCREVPPCGELDQLLRLRGAGRERLLDEDVFALFQGGLGQLEVRVDGRHDGDGVDLRRDHQLARVGRGCDVGIRLGHALERAGTPVADARDFAAVDAAQIPDDVRAPVAVADHTDSNHGLALEVEE